MRYGHSRDGAGGELEYQAIETHLEGTARLAGDFAASFGAPGWGRLCGLWHDLGKFSGAFQERITGKSTGRVDHSTFGARHAHERLGIPGLLAAYAIAGHHGGLPNGKDGSASDLASRLARTGLSEPQDIPEYLLESEKPGALPLRIAADKTRMAFQVSFFVRLLFSCLVDADFLDTERFMDPKRHALRVPGPELSELEARLGAHLASIRNGSTRVNVKRSEILDACLLAAQSLPGLFSLTVPTGGGKTLSSLAFALRHAALHGLRRVIYVIPYMSIIEQNARVFREVLGDEAVVEHHSTFTPGSLGKGLDEESPAYRRARLASENWDAPVVVTTNVQFFESLFANRSSRCRKLHNVAGSVVVLDEAQMLPVEYLRPCLEALRELTANYGTSVVLCTATQPALSTSPSFPDGLDGVREIVRGLDGIEEAFDRVELEDAGTLSTEALAQALAGERQALCIVNTRNRAAELFALLRERPGARHLSARMCPAHRSLVLDGIRSDLAAGRPCLTVSTQLVEAGVDVDFPLVYRELAGLDSIAQAAGRCNREGLLGEGRRGLTRVFRHEAGMPRMFRPAADSAQSTLRRFAEAPFSARAVRDYFANYYWRRAERLDSKGILAALSADVDRLNFPFRDVAQAFRLIENDMLPVIVPWEKDGEDLVDKLRHAPFPGAVLRQLQRYTVQVYRPEFMQLNKQGALEILDESYAVLVQPESYSDVLGLVIETDSRAANHIV